MCSRHPHGPIFVQPNSVTHSNDLQQKQRSKRQHQQRSRSVVATKRHINTFISAVHFVFFVHPFLLHRVSVAAFISKRSPPTTRASLIKSSTQISNGLFANNNNYRHDAGPSEHDDELLSEISCEPNKSNIKSGTSRNKVVVTRRATLASAVSLASTIIPQYSAIATTNINDNTTPSQIIEDTTPIHIQSPIIPSLTIPLQYQPTLSAYTISYKIGQSSTFGAIIDTGSPFLLVPTASSETSCRPDYKWGCFHPEESRVAPGLGPTMERFDGNEGLVEWREGEFSFDIPTSPPPTVAAKNDDKLAKTNLEDDTLESDMKMQSILFPNSLMTFGVISESLMDGPGGIFLGLVKNTDKRIRPSFLGQSDVSAFSIDLRDKKKSEGGSEGSDTNSSNYSKSLTLYAGSSTTKEEKSQTPKKKKNMSERISSLNGMFDAQKSIRLVNDLNTKYGDPTIHYVGMASSITANGSTLVTTSTSSSSSRRRNNDKLYCIFDTGCSGMSISPSLFDERYAAARANKEKSLWGQVDVELQTVGGETVTLSAKRPITTPLGSEMPWGKKLDGHLIVLGLSFLEGVKMTVDADGGMVWFED